MTDDRFLPFPERVKLLAQERELSVERVAHDAWDPAIRGTSPNFLKKVMRGERRANLALYQAIARALNVSPSEFPEYRLALARRLFDEEEWGLAQALEHLSQLDAALSIEGEEVAVPGSGRASPRAGPAGSVGSGSPAKGSGR